MTDADLETILTALAGKILPAPHGPESTALNHGLHFTGGEPFANFPLLCRAVEISAALRIPSTFVETNCYWCNDDDATLERLHQLNQRGLRGIMISVNPFYLEHVPFERTERAVRCSLEVFGRNTMIYQLDYFNRFSRWGFRGRVRLEEYLRYEKKAEFAANAEFFIMGRAPYELKDLLLARYPLREARCFFGEPCFMPFVRELHNHFDLHGNYIPGFCAGITFGDCRRLDELLREGVDSRVRPVLGALMAEDIAGLFRLARERGYRELREGYFSKCHLCTDLRRHLALSGDFPELQPRQFYQRLVAAEGFPSP